MTIPGGNENFGGEGTIIVAQENSRVRMTTDQFIATFSVEQKAASYDALPKITFTESLTLHLNGETIQSPSAALSLFEFFLRLILASCDELKLSFESGY